MPLPEKWASPEDFTTIFQYLWYRDFPVTPLETGARRVDWTIHIGIIVHTIANLMGLRIRFERGGKKDAVLRSKDGDEIAVEWEWGGVWGNELDKLKSPTKVWSPDKSRRLLKYSVLITYTHVQDQMELEKVVYSHVQKKWKEADWPLLLILITEEKTKPKIFSSKEKFRRIHMSLFDTNGRREELRLAPAFPWEVPSTRWSYQLKSAEADTAGKK